MSFFENGSEADFAAFIVTDFKIGRDFTDPIFIARGADAEIPSLAIEATQEDADTAMWPLLSCSLKIFFSMGLAPSLWQGETGDGAETLDEASRARKKLIDLFSLVCSCTIPVFSFFF
jgi:hypothetical protein